MSFTLTKEFKFEASHQLKHHGGKCSRLHGHSWKCRVYIQGSELQPNYCTSPNMLIDYGKISAIVQPWVDNYLDHWHLNDSLEQDNPTSELVAVWLFQKLKQNFIQLEMELRCKLIAVEVDETCTSSCRFEPGEINA